MDFDATILEAVGITNGAVLSVEFQSNLENDLGQVNYAAGTLGAGVESPFQLATIRFISLAPSGQSGSTVIFAPLANPRLTKSVTAGIENTGRLDPITILVE